MLCAKNRSKKDQIFEKWDHFENRPSCQGYSPCKILTLGQKLKFKETCQNPFYQTFIVFLFRNRSKKDQIFEKWDHFEHGPLCKGYSPCKILTLGQKLNFKKTCQNPFYKSFTVDLCKKPLENRPNIREMRPFWKLAIMQRLKPVQNPHFGSKIKIPKNMSKFILQIIYSCFVQKNARKKTKYLRNETILKIGHHAKAIYSPCKILSLGQKLKFKETCQNLFYQTFTVFLFKKPLEKRPNIREMRPFWKWAIMQRL